MFEEDLLSPGSWESRNVPRARAAAESLVAVARRIRGDRRFLACRGYCFDLDLLEARNYLLRAYFLALLPEPRHVAYGTTPHWLRWTIAGRRHRDLPCLSARHPPVGCTAERAVAEKFQIASIARTSSTGMCAGRWRRRGGQNTNRALPASKWNAHQASFSSP